MLAFCYRFSSDDDGEYGQGFRLQYEMQNCDADDRPTNESCGSTSCGGHFTAESGVLTSPYYPRNYPDYTECIYSISRPANTNISIIFTFIDIESSDQGCYDYIEFYDGDYTYDDSRGIVCGTTFTGPIVSTHNTVWLR